MPDLISADHPNLLVTSPRIEFADGTASYEGDLTGTQLAHLSTVGVTIAGDEAEPEAGNEAEPEAEPEAGNEAEPEAGNEARQAKRRRKTDV